MSRRVVLGILLLVLSLSLLSCRAGIYDPELVVQHKPPRVYPFDVFQEARLPGGNGVLVAGVGVVDISPYNYRVWISGFGAGNISRGVRDPVYARALFLDDGRESIVLVSLDLTGLLKTDVDRIRALVTQRFPERILVASTHNHLAPDTLGYWGYGIGFPLESGILEEYQQEMIHGAAEAVHRAVATAQPARLRFGSVTIPEGYSSNIWFPDDPTAKDNEMTVLRAEDLAGRPIATLVNWPCHAEAMMGKGHKVSAEFPGQFYRAIAERGGGEGIFFQGALGGMVSPYVTRWDTRKEYDFQDRLEFNERLGRLLAEKADEAVAVGLPLDAEDVSIRLFRKDIVLPIEGWMFRLAGEMGVFRDPERAIEVDGTVSIPTEVNVIGLGPATIVTVPGEIFPSIGFAIKDRMQTPYRFVFGLACDELGYMMTPEQFADKTYKYERQVSLGPRTGALVQAAVFELLDRYQREEAGL